MVRRSSFAIAAALTSVALTTTAAVSVTAAGGDAVGSPSTTAAAEPAAPPVVTHPEVRSASAKADAVLADAAYVTREGDLSAKERKRVRAAAQNLRTLVNHARDTTGTPAGSRPAAASRDGDRVSLSERAADPSAAPDRAPGDAAADVTAPTNLVGAGVLAIDEQGSTGLPALDTPLADSAHATSGARNAGAEASDEVSDKAGDKASDKASDKAAKAPAAAPAKTADRIEKVTVKLQRLITKADADVVVSVKAGPTPEEIAAAKKAAAERRAARAARAAEREAAQARQAAAARAAEAREMADAAKSYGNGQIPSSVLCGLSWAPEQKLRCDAADALEDLNDAFRAAFGRNLDVVDGYRSYAEQVSVAASRGALAAVPGTSNHGLGQAVDLSGGVQSFGSAEHGWMAAHAGKYGWKLPAWAQAGGSKPEAWHWEYGTSY